MKICFIGNSHLGPLAASSLAMESETNTEKRAFFISRTYGQQPLRIVGDSEVAVLDMVNLDIRSGADSVIFTEEWDHFVIVGFGFSLIAMVESWKDYQPDEFPADLGGQLLTPDLTAEYNDYVVDNTQAGRLISKLREVTNKPISLVPAPLPAEWARTESGERLEAFHSFADESAESFVLRSFAQQKQRFLAKGVGVMTQPNDTVAGSMWTQTEYCLGQPGVEDPKEFFNRRDFYHMNKKFGERLLTSILDQLHEHQES